jgi:DNA-binding transcriptional MocR family regulator
MPSLPAKGGGPIYLGIAEAMAADIASGRLRPGQRLPPHRALAAALGIDLTTVTRAYNEARRRGLIDAGAGRGTFVRIPSEHSPARRRDEPRAAAVDTSMNLPPAPAGVSLRERLSDGLAGLGRRDDFLSLLSYRPSAGGEEDRAAGADWLRARALEATAERVVVCPGAQAALLILLTSIVRPGDVVLTEALTYPGLRALAAHVGVRLLGVATDGEGLLPGALEEACRREKPKALYCVPTIHNPTTATMSAERRAEIAGIVRRHSLLVFEDDAYGYLPTPAPKPLAAYVPDLAFHISTLAKCLTPGLRVAYLLVPGPSHAVRMAAALRATVLMAPPLTASLATRWIQDGSARAILDGVRTESMARQRIAREILPAGTWAAHPQGHHLWLSLPPAWTGAEFAAHARRHGLAVVPSDAFAVEGASAPNAVRVSLGAAHDRDRLRHALQVAADALTQSPAMLFNVV